MDIKRYILFARKLHFMVLKDGFARADFLRKKRLLAGIGKNVYFYSRIFPPDPKLLKLHDNVCIATNVRFLGHDRCDIMLSGMFGKTYGKKYGCIEVEDNEFIGSDCVILPGVRIEKNTIVGAGAVVTRDLPSGFVWGGVPARKIGSFDEFVAKRKDELDPEKDPETLWKIFNKQRSGDKQ